MAVETKIGSDQMDFQKSENKIAGNFYAGTADPTDTTRLNYDGHFYATKIYNAVFNDLAEFMTKDPDYDEAEPGMVLTQGENGVRASNKRADKAVIGVYSDTFGYAFGAKNEENKYPVGISGIVWVWVKEPLEIGDSLVSYIDGFATLAKKEELCRVDLIIGKVLKSKTSSEPERIKTLIC